MVSYLRFPRPIKQWDLCLTCDRLATRTVAFHKYQMMGKFRLGSTAELVQFAIRQGLIT